MRLLVGNDLPDGVETVAQAYAGHQFGGFSPRLGDGRALLLGELVGPDGARRDLHLKGSGRTPFARGGDGLASVGPMLRELIMCEAMHALGVPTTRALAVVATGGTVVRETELPGAVLARVASSHLRVGSFQYAASRGDLDLLRRLTDHAIARHAPEAADAELPALALLEHVARVQADLVARWMLLGFVHGVMNTDNTTISGETIDYGPCAFVDAWDPGAVFSSIDHGGRYALGNQPAIVRWNLARLAETLLPLLDDDVDRAVELATEPLTAFPDRYRDRWRAGMAAKLGLRSLPAAGTGADGGEHGAGDGPGDLSEDVLALLAEHRVDLTSFFRSLSSHVRDGAPVVVERFPEPTAATGWVERWDAARAAEGRDPVDVAASMDAVNPVYVPRNHLVEEALAAGVEGDLGPLARLRDAVERPFEERPGLERYAEPAPAGFTETYRTFCGT